MTDFLAVWNEARFAKYLQSKHYRIETDQCNCRPSAAVFTIVGRPTAGNHSPPPHLIIPPVPRRPVALQHQPYSTSPTVPALGARLASLGQDVTSRDATVDSTPPPLPPPLGGQQVRLHGAAFALPEERVSIYHQKRLRHFANVGLGDKMTSFLWKWMIDRRAQGQTA